MRFNGHLMRQARLAHGITITQMGARVGVAYATVASWESCRATPKVTDARRVADVLGLTLDELLGSDDGARVDA